MISCLCVGFRSISAQTAEPNNILVDDCSIGYIVYDDSMFTGSGFVAVKQNYVFTCYHVIDGRQNITFKSNCSDKLIPLKIKYSYPYLDLCILESDVPISNSPYNPVSEFTPEINDAIYYAGYHLSDSGRVVFGTSKSHVQSIGIGMLDSINYAFIEFVGIGLPGFSGSPVFNKDGEVIAMIAMGFYIKNYSNSYQRYMNRAFSLIPVIE